jgi:hypothetical protein
MDKTRLSLRPSMRAYFTDPDDARFGNLYEDILCMEFKRIKNCSTYANSTGHKVQI